MPFYVYIITNARNNVLYTGVTNSVEKRIFEHKQKIVAGSFAAKYNINKLVHFEETPNVKDAIAREKQIKGWKREKKIALIEENNPGWKDLLRDSSLRSE